MENCGEQLNRIDLIENDGFSCENAIQRFQLHVIHPWRTCICTLVYHMSQRSLANVSIIETEHWLKYNDSSQDNILEIKCPINLNQKQQRRDAAGHCIRADTCNKLRIKCLSNRSLSSYSTIKLLNVVRNNSACRLRWGKGRYRARIGECLGSIQWGWTLPLML